MIVKIIKVLIGNFDSLNGTLTCRIQTPGLSLGLVLEFPPLFFHSALGFLFSPPLSTIVPLFFSYVNLPCLLFCPCFSLLPILGYYSALGFQLFPTLGIIMPWSCVRQVRVSKKFGRSTHLNNCKIRLSPVYVC